MNIMAPFINKTYFRGIKLSKRFILTSFVLLVSLANLRAQDPAYYKIGEDEFSNSDIYSLFYDENTDLLYVGTNNGLYVYSQNEFHPIKKVENQIGNSFFGLKQNSKGEIFCFNLNGQIFKVNENKLELYYQHKNKPADKLLSFQILNTDNLFIVSEKGIVKKDGKGNVTRLVTENSPLTNNNDTIHLLRSGEYCDNSIMITASSKDSIYVLELTANQSFEILASYAGMEKNIRTFVNLNGRTIGANIDGGIEQFKYDGEKDLHVNYEKQEKERLFSLNDSIVLGLNPLMGVRYHYLNQDTLTCSPLFFNNLFISHFTQLKSGALLLGTFGEGIFVVRNPTFRKQLYDQLLLGIDSSPDNIVAVSTRSGEVFKEDVSGVHLIDKTTRNVDDVYYIPNNKMVHFLGYDEFIYNDSKRNMASTLDIIKVGDSVIAYGWPHNFGINSPYDILPGTSRLSKWNNYHQGILFDRVKSVEWYPVDSLFYLATNLGIRKVRWNEFDSESILYNDKELYANDLYLEENTLIIGTATEGVIILENEEPIFQLNEEKGLLSNSVSQVEYKNNNLFIITRGGIQVYDLKKNAFIELGRFSQVAIDKVRKFALSDDKLWLLEKHSYYALELAKINSTDLVPEIFNLYFDSLIVNNELVNFEIENSFSYNENEFKFYFDYRHLETKKEVKLEYTLEGFYKSWRWVNSDVNMLEFQSLPPGVYTFKVRAKNGISQSNMFEYRFEIFPPFWQTWWFYSSVLLLVLLVVTIYVRRRIAKVKKKELLKLEKQKMLTETIDSKLKALRSQMNPHFIFNSLNSIQALILRQDTTKSYDYVVMFADLVRKTLQYSDEDFINVENEISFLETYLKLESLRMKEEFSFEIKYERNLDVKIPSLMIQPFVENAIHHGLLHKDGEKRIIIHFTFDSDMTCVITDNGIGREKAREIKARQNSSHKSFSLEATKQRMKIIEEQTGNSFGYEIIDLNPEGTKVVVKIPFKLEF